MELHQTMEQTSNPAHDNGHGTMKQGLLTHTLRTAGTSVVRCSPSARKSTDPSRRARNDYRVPSNQHHEGMEWTIARHRHHAHEVPASDKDEDWASVHCGCD